MTVEAPCPRCWLEFALATLVGSSSGPRKCLSHAKRSAVIAGVGVAVYIDGRWRLEVISQGNFLTTFGEVSMLDTIMALSVQKSASSFTSFFAICPQ